MALTEGAADLMQRLARLPAAPHVDPLLRGEPVPFSLCHKHHPQKMNSYQMVLHRPVETAFRLIGEQIDGSFDLQGNTYLVEAKWQATPIGNSEFQSFAGRCERKRLGPEGCT
jgi:hypothetical protein